jgi:predicted AAA+ superfamily ATPase
MFIAREAASALEQLAAGFPIVWLTGPRQSGKTTLARSLRPDLPYINLELPDQREFARTDPRGFLAAYALGAVVDEVQHAPDLMSWLQADVDANGQMGRWWLTGSQQPAIAAGISQSLAGRVGRVELLPLAGSELLRADQLPATLDELLYRGGYPAIYDRDVDPHVWLANYVATYVERDVRSLAAIRDLETFTRFVRMCAARSGQLLNTTSLGNDVGVSQQTVKAWLSILRATYVVDLVEPYHVNVTTRLVKTPKLVFLDVGLMAYLIGITDASQIAGHPLRGALFETWALTETLKGWRNATSSRRLTFLRDKNGAELDLVYTVGATVHGTEFKAGATIASDWIRPARLWRSRLANANWAPLRVVYGGEIDSSRVSSEGVPVDYVGWRSFTAHP